VVKKRAEQNVQGGGGGGLGKAKFGRGAADKNGSDGEGAQWSILEGGTVEHRELRNSRLRVKISLWKRSLQDSMRLEGRERKNAKASKME